jgi:alpha-methylacyl-CoA racemase
MGGPVKSGPLNGVRVVEISGLGPTPFAAMLLADMGADVVRIERPDARALLPQNPDFLNRGRPVVSLDLKSDEGRTALLERLKTADLMIEGLRPGVMERLNLGPDIALKVNPKLVYGRMTGWGQTGPLAQTAGHDINYIALTGALHAIGTAETPVAPLNLLGDFGGGALYLVNGLLAALLAAERSGKGQVVDCAIVDGTASLMTMIYSMANSGLWQDRRAKNILDGGAPYYGVYRCADGRFLAVGAIEPQFYAALLAGLDLEPGTLPAQHDQTRWPALRAAIAQRISEKTRDDWAGIFNGTDACVAPVLSMAEAPTHPYNTARNVFDPATGEPRPAPRFTPR